MQVRGPDEKWNDFAETHRLDKSFSVEQHNERHIITYKSKSNQEMSREELLEVIETLIEALKAARKETFDAISLLAK